MFIGSFFNSIDPKGRISIPAELRKYLKAEANNTFVLTRGTGKFIAVYPMDKFKELLDTKLTGLNTFDPEAMKFARYFAQDAFERTLDSQSRLILPKSLKEHALIENEVLVKGVIKYIELWNPTVYEGFVKEYADSYPDVAKEVMKE